MGGAVIDLESEKLVRQGMNQGRVQMIIELGQEDGLGDEVIIERLQRKVGLSLENAKLSLAQYGKEFA